MPPKQLSAELLHRITEAALQDPHYPSDLVKKALHEDGKDGPIPTLTKEQKEAARHALKAIASFRAASPQSLEQDPDMAYLWFQQCGLHIVFHELGTARTELEVLGKVVRPRPTSNASILQLNVQVLGALQWITGALNDSHASQKYAKWRSNALLNL